MLTAVILTKNEEKMIADCIESLLFCDQILVIDDESTDRTVSIIKKMSNPKVHVRVRPLENDFAKQRNFGLSEASGEWILFIDADERVTLELQKEIQQVISQDDDISGYFLKRRDHLFGKKMLFGETGKIQLLRLVKKGKGEWKGRVHEEFYTKGKTSVLQNELLHYPHQNISDFLSKVNYYSTLRAEELFEKKVRSNILFIIGYPKLKFIKNYLFLSGYKDGTLGFIHAVIMSLHSFLVRAKLYLLWKGIGNT